MLDFSFSEIGLTLIIALLVFGPKRLPGAARTLGKWMGQGRRFFAKMQQEANNFHEEMKGESEDKS